MELGPVSATLKAQSDESAILLKVLAGLLFLVATALSIVRWNPVNGVPVGLTCLSLSAYIAFSQFTANNGEFALDLLYIVAAIMGVAGIHLLTNTNPLMIKPKPKKK
jgi:hypothetical protein